MAGEALVVAVEVGKRKGSVIMSLFFWLMGFKTDEWVEE